MARKRDTRTKQPAAPAAARPAPAQAVEPAAPPAAGPPPLGGEPGRQWVNWLFPAYVGLILVGIFVFRLKATMPGGNEMSFDRAVLASVDAATLTGFPQRDSLRLYKTPGQAMLLVLTVGGSLFSLIAGGLAVVRIVRLPFTDGQVVRAALIAEGVALFVGATGLYGLGGSTLGGLSQGASAFGNAGNAIGSPAGLFDLQSYVLVFPLAILGGLGLPLLMELIDLARHQRPLSEHARATLLWTAGVYVVGVAIFALLQWVAADFTRDPDRMRGLWAASSAAALDSRSAGIPFVDLHVRDLPRAMQWVLVLFMAVGAGSAGTAGGLKLTTIAALAGGARRSLRGQTVGRSFGIAMAWVGIYFGMALLGLALLLNAEPQTGADKVLFLTVSALSNVGLAPFDTLVVSIQGTYVVAALMLAGRMVPVLILWWMADTTRDADLAIG